MESHLATVFLGLTVLFLHAELSTARPQSTDRPMRKYRDCHERWVAGERQSGIYEIFPALNGTQSYKVMCNHTDTGSYTVIQQRVDGTVSFALPFSYYKRGFGHPATNYWAGLDLIYHLTHIGNNHLTISMHDWNYQTGFITYGYFSILDQSQGYRLSIAHPIKGTVPDDMSFQNGMYFYTYDYPDHNNCAIHMKAGWWYNYCAYALPNGHYYSTGGPYAPSGGFYDGIFWRDWRGFGYSLKYIQMEVSRP